MRLAQAAAVVLTTAGLAQGQDLTAFRPMPRPILFPVAAAPDPGPDDLLLPRPILFPVAALPDSGPLPRPMPRPEFSPVVPEVPTVHPQPRPSSAAAAPVVRPNPPPAQPVAPAVTPPLPSTTTSPVAPPVTKPVTPPVSPPLTKTVTPPVTPPVTKAAQKPAKTSMQGAVCQRPEIKGKALAPIQSRVKGCNVPDAVQVAQVAGVALTPPATIDCEEATALSDWVTRGLEPAFNGQIVALDVVDSYACRPRNNVPGNPVSVHGLGQAIDIAGFVTKSGRTYTVAQDYNAQIRAAQKAGCGVFHTILGPGSDGYHENHIHLDVAHHGGGNYCH